MKRFRSSIVVLVLILFLFGASGGCRKKPVFVNLPAVENKLEQPIETKKEPEPSTKPTPTIPEIAKPEKPKPNIPAQKRFGIDVVKLDLTTKTKKLLTTIPFMANSKIKLSPDKKKFAFQTIRRIGDSNFHDFYTMNIDGSGIKKIIQDVNTPFNQENLLDFCFSPNNKQVLLRYLSISKNSNLDPQSIYIIETDGSKINKYSKEDPLFPIYFFLFEKINNKKLDMIRTNSQNDDFVVRTGKTIGIFSWTDKKFSPLHEHQEAIKDCSVSPDGNHILFTVDKGSKIMDKTGYTDKLYDLYWFNISMKTVKQLVKSNTFDFSKICWLQDNNQFLYGVRTGYDLIMHRLGLFDLFLFDIKKDTNEKVLSNKSVDSIKYYYNDKILITYMSNDGAFFSIFDVKSKVDAELGTYAIFDISFLGKDLLVFAWSSFYLYDTITRRVKFEITKESFKEDFYIRYPTLSPDQSKFFFIIANQIFVYNMKGQQLYKGIHYIQYAGRFYTSEPFITGLFISPSEIIYLEEAVLY